MSAATTQRAGRLIGGAATGKALAYVVLTVGVVYALYPVLWLFIASTKGYGELYTTSTLIPSFTGGLQTNLVNLFSWENGAFMRWVGNSLLYAGGGAILSTLIAAAAGYGLAKYHYPGRTTTMLLLVSGILVPAVMLAIPQYLLFSSLNLAGSYASVLIPSLVNPLGVFLCMVYAQSAVPDEMLEAGRLDGAGEYRIFGQLALAPMFPSLVTVFLLQFVGIWNNYLLPYIMLSDDSKFPLTVGLSLLINRGPTEPAFNNLAIVGSLVSAVPLILLFIVLQRFWRIDLISGSVKG
ncbi:carbohydrate ABC transporter permease [Microbacterium sp. SSM24]|uniref:carbohydrate ABC transporter permease n=1 Tax=Microbacterium sp. SSM24 TaxID=2991714 RepID=UPI00222693C8|nr:carbohydrate ABC transporter permease [Microbacterium sp. SSM24]MCW3492583.1 carbohydrate ABC transporter permease [Microbacterium sp. SSM24]